MTRLGLPAVLLLGLATACGAPKLTSQGTIAIDGQPRSAKACGFSGSGADVVMTLELDDGEKLGLPIHGGKITLDRGGKKLVLGDCEKSSFAGGGSSSSYHGHLELACKGDGAALDLALDVGCGEAGPSNEKR